MDDGKSKSELAIDLSVIREASDGDTAFEQELFEVFVEDCRERLDRLAKAVRNGDIETSRRESHTLKGAAANIGAESMRARALALERTDVLGENALAQERFAALQEAYQEVREFIERHLAG